MGAVVLAAGVFSADAELVFSTTHTADPVAGPVVQLFRTRLANGTWTTPVRMMVNDDTSAKPVNFDGRAFSTISLR